MLWRLFSGIFFVSALACGVRLIAVQGELAATRAELIQAQAASREWFAAAQAARGGAAAVTDQAQACLEREAAAHTAAAELRELLDMATTRPLTEPERREVPDAATRERLCRALDAPL